MNEIKIIVKDNKVNIITSVCGFQTHKIDNLPINHYRNIEKNLGLIAYFFGDVKNG